MFLKIASAVFVLSLVGASVSAATLTTTFNLEGNDPSKSTSENFAALPSAFSLNQDGLTATFNAKSVDAVRGRNNVLTRGNFIDSKIGRYSSGAGVLNGVGDSHTVNGGDRDDIIEITFERDVRVISMTFGYYGPRSAFRLLTDKNDDHAIGVGDAYSSTIHINGNDGTYTFDTNSATTDFIALGAFVAKDWFKLTSVTVSHESLQRNEPVPTPLPATVWMMIAGLGGLSLVRARKKV